MWKGNGGVYGKDLQRRDGTGREHPLVEASNIEQQENLKARLLVKLEYLNPAGSVKDRVGKAMIEDAEQTGRLKPGSASLNPPQAIRASAWRPLQLQKGTG